MFKVGQKIVLVEIIGINAPFMNWPKIGEVVTCAGVSTIYPDSIYLVEYPVAKDGAIQSIHASLFRPLLGDSALTELTEAFTETKETSDFPVRQPETV